MKTPAPRVEARRGFALIITIVLVAFLVLILVGLATFTRVETQVADNSQQIAKARQNALMALNIAIGQLQKTTGPDQRVTATADLQPLATVANPASYPTSDPASGESLSGSASGAGNPLDKIDAYWSASRNRHWVGAWKNGNSSSFDVDEPVKFNPVPELQAWLVSGNEAVADKFKPTDAVPGVTYAVLDASGAATSVFTTHPADPDAAAARTYRLLVGKNTAGIAAAADTGRAVFAPQVKIESDNVPGLSGGQTVGHYAWWVGDEGVKAKANVIDAYSTSPNAEENRNRLQSAQRPVVEAINANLENIYKANDPMLEKLVNFDQLGFTAPNTTDLNDFYRPRFHDLTLHSQGVLADSKRGGLKGDFSKILGQSSDITARDDLRAVIGDNALSLSDNILTPQSTIYATKDPAVFTGGDYDLGLVYTPTWSQLRSFFNMGNTAAQVPAGVMTDATGTAAQSRLQTRTTQGIGPVMSQVKFFFGLEIDGSNAVQLKVRPLVVLANPYNFELRGTWWLRVNSPSLEVRMGNFDPAATPPTPTAPPAYPESSDTGLFPDATAINGFRGRLNLVFRDAVIPAGRAVVFCLDQNYVDPATSTTPLELKMVQGLDELNTFKWKTAVTYTAATAPVVRYVTLHTGQSRIDARLFGADPSANTNAEDNLVTAVFAQPASSDGACFLVPPISSGSADGGGTWFVRRDSLRTDIGALARQMSPFIQFNYRAMYNLNAGYGGTANHVLEPARSYTQKNASTAPDAFKNDLLIDGSGDYARWGPVTKGKVGAATTVPDGVGADTGFKNILYDLPRPNHPLASFGQLQHFNPAGFINGGKVGGTNDGKGFTVTVNTFQLNYPVANSYVNPWMPRHLVLNGEGKAGIQYDGSWLFNETLADRFFFSSYPGAGGNTPGTYKRINDRLSLRDSTISEADFLGGPRAAANSMLLDGAFNINSTSVAAWKAVLSATRKVPVGGDASVNVGFARTLYQPEKYNSARDGVSKDAWAGHTNLTDAEIDKLAREIVLQIHRRGPFLSLADFYNRRLIERGSDPAAFKLGVSGAIQSAIDAILNPSADVDATFRVQSDTGSFPTGEAADYRMRTMTAGAPGYLLQGDVLSTLAPSLSARSDTFVIRTYGDAYNPATGETTGQAWCEAVVQRLPEYVDKTDAAEKSTSALTATNAQFGRRYEVVSFRWLAPDDI